MSAGSPMRSVSSPTLNVRMTGDKELRSLMQNIAPKMQQKIFMKAIKPALETMRQKAIANVSQLSVKEPTTKVRKAIASKIKIIMKGRQGSKYKTKGKLAVFYGVSGKERKGAITDKGLMASLAHLIEFGFKLTHYFGYKMGTKKIPANPFMRPAFDSQKSQAEAKFLSVIREAVEQAGLK